MLLGQHGTQSLGKQELHTLQCYGMHIRGQQCAPGGPPWPGPCVSMSGARPRCALFCAALALLASSACFRASSISCQSRTRKKQISE